MHSMCVTKALCVSHGAACRGFSKELSKSDVCIYILIFLWKPCDPSQIAAFSVFYLFEYGQRHGFLMLWCHVCVWRKIINHSTISHHVWVFLNERAGGLLSSNLKIVEWSLHKYNLPRDQISYDFRNYIAGITYYLEICTMDTPRALFFIYSCYRERSEKQDGVHGS